MAPDLNAVAAATPEKWDYSTPGSSGYHVPDITMHDPANHRVRVLTIGAGVSGILVAYQVQKYCQNVDLKLYEKNSDVGGTWLENRYPGCACDIPSHAYTYNFALNPNWPHFFSHSPTIFGYLCKVCEVFDLRRYMTFDVQVVGAYWQDEEGEWLVKLRETKDGGVRDFEERCDVLLNGTGLLNNYKWPKIAGLDRFKGKIVHTAVWPKDYQAEQWKNDRVAVIGSGASSIQTVPTMAPHVKHMDIFVRTAVWFVELAGHRGENKEYTAEQKKEFLEDPDSLIEHAKSIEDQVNGLWGGFYSDTPAQDFMKDLFEKRMAEFLTDKRLLAGFTPKFGVGCRRVTPGDPYMMALGRENIDVHFTEVESLTEKGVVGADGVEREVDTVVCATGFDTSYRPRFPIVGKNGIDLKDKWAKTPESYLGISVPDFPNYYCFISSTWPVENGSVMGPLLSVSEYAVKMIKKMQKEGIKSMTPKQDVTDQFNEHAQEWLKHTVWKEGCRSWYRDNDTGRVNAVWPGASLHYQLAIDDPRFEDYNIEYWNKHNMFAYMGMGWTPALTHNTKINAAAMGISQEGEGAKLQGLATNGGDGSLKIFSGGDEAKFPQPSNPLVKAAGTEKLDVSPYINTRNLDPRWLAANGLDVEKAKEIIIKAVGDHAMAEKRKEIERLERKEGDSSVSTTGFSMGLL